MNDKIFFQKQKIESDFTLIIKSQEGFTILPEWKTLEYSNLFDSKIDGIPQNVELNKRNIAKYMINEYGFQSFGITTLDGKMYASIFFCFSTMRKSSSITVANNDHSFVCNFIIEWKTCVFES